MRPSPSTSATSPRRSAFSIWATYSRSASPPPRASSCTARPPSKRTTSPSTRAPLFTLNGFVAFTTPSAGRGSGAVKTSSVGRFGRCVTPPAVVAGPPCQWELGRRPIVRSVPRAFEVQRVEPAPVERLGCAPELLESLFPGGDRVRLVEPANVLELRPERRERLVRLELRVN